MLPLTMNHPKFNKPIVLTNHGTSWTVDFEFPDGNYDCEHEDLLDAYNDALAISMVKSNAEYDITYNLYPII